MSMATSGHGSRKARTVLHMGKYYPPYEGGIENHVQSLCDGLSEHYDVTALVFNTGRKSTHESVNGVEVLRAGSLARVLSTEISPSYLTRFARMRRADLVHLHVPNPVGEIACLALPRRTRLVVTYHSDVVRQKLLGRLNRLILHRVLRRADRIIVFTRRYMESSPVLRHHMDKCAIIPHGIDLAEMRLTDRAAGIGRDLRQRHGEPLILFVGRLVYYKGVDVLLRALPHVPEARLLIIGDGPLKESLEASARQAGVASQVSFLSKVPHEVKVAACHAARFLVLPATHRSEAFGLVQVEALAAGLPVISTDIDSGVPFVNAHGVTGLVVPPRDAGALGAAMRSLLDDEALRRSFSEAARARAQGLFSRSTMIRDSRALYESLLPGGADIPLASPGGVTAP